MAVGEYPSLWPTLKVRPLAAQLFVRCVAHYDQVTFVDGVETHEPFVGDETSGLGCGSRSWTGAHR
jgi:hypothetical protein